jgi:hypothetical protein
VLVYESVDFSYTDPLGQDRHFITQMTAIERQRVAGAAQRFVEDDIGPLTGGVMVPEWEIRFPERSLTLEAAGNCVWAPGGQGYWPGPDSTSSERDPSFDAVFVVWKDWGEDLETGETYYIGCFGGLAWHMGTGQTYTTAKLQNVSNTSENVFKHEFGHSILFYYAAAGLSPVPAVDNHVDVFDPQYVHCVPTPADAYAFEDGRLVEHPDTVPNSAYHNDSGFTHDYYSGTAALRTDPGRCLGIRPSDWARGGPVTRPSRPANDDFEGALGLAGFSGSASATNVGASGQPADPFPLDGLRSVWWHWKSPSFSSVMIDTEGSELDTVLAVYSGDAFDQLELVAWNDDVTTDDSSAVAFVARADTTYWIAVDGAGGTEGEIVLTWAYDWSGTSPACMDGIDNDDNGLIDFDGGYAGGVAASELTAPDPHCVDTWPFWPYWEALPACGLGAELVLALPPLYWLHRRLRRARAVPATP